MANVKNSFPWESQKSLPIEAAPFYASHVVDKPEDLGAVLRSLGSYSTALGTPGRSIPQESPVVENPGNVGCSEVGQGQGK